MTISTVNSYSYATSSSSTGSSSSTLGLTSSDFLSLMLTQLQNQNPLDPTDTDTYLDRMVSYASYDTQTEISEQLSSIASSVSQMISGSGLGYLGQTVEAYGNTTTLADGAATWGYSLESTASEVTITIYDESGKSVWSGAGETGAGSHYFSWDGITSSGTQLEDGGSYTISVTATDASGNDVSGSTTVIGKVTGIDVDNGSSVLKIGDASVLVGNILTIRAA
ncbi:flagellar hook assembly protein FlgD [Polymorphum gilvum]|uniref:Basal-body rod modification protein FlgD n=1 Tax=Polymorphum gilvum (strain LMG 25793 / CGMCC 1.9160 / SL003B-26A1) TaxID=991905 RepID=F2J616_POLGS|nr:FlgD immunoglobulin-like domain containing protein [Polymorphum gilvum]ADZ72380.1 Flagellar hook capping protein [Polymorphum gilvum SL003B-26A1]